ncbi:MAG: hypothetical protein AB2A00_31805 [Myxococcota bacterium]
MKIAGFVATAFAAAALLFSTPAVACPGESDAPVTAAKLPVGKQLTLTGVVMEEGCPMEAKEMGCTGRVLVLEDGGKYMIMKNKGSEKMIAAVKQNTKVTVKADVVEKNGHTMVRIKSFKPVANS